MKKTAIQKESLTKAKILKGIKMVAPTSSVLPVLESVLLDSDFITITDLENYVSIPFKNNLKDDVVINAKQFISAMGMLENPKLSLEKLKKAEENKIGTVEISESGLNRKIKIVSNNPGNFPKDKIDDDFNELGYFNETDLRSIKIALMFASNDDLRPAMTGVFVKDEIVATDAHRLFWTEVSQPLFDKAQMIIPPKTAKLLLHFGGNWKIFGKNQVAAFLNDDGVMIQARLIDARFPDYKVVIPDGEPKTILISDTATWRNELKNASKFCNVSTKQGTINLNGSISLSAWDVDFETEYQREFKATECEYKGEKMRIAFNMDLLDDVLSTLPNDEPLKINLFGPTKAAIINDHYLLMPLMLNE